MKIFRLNDCDWYMGNTLEEAIAAAMDDTGLPRDEVADEDARELTEEEMDRKKFVDDDTPAPTDEGPVARALRKLGRDTVTAKRTFREELARLIAAGTAKPGMFAYTEY